jgi:hypothetical protein
MNQRLRAAVVTLTALALGACASATDATTAAQPEPVQREYRTGSKFPVKDPRPAMTQQERDKQVEEARAAAQSMQTGQPPAGMMGR